MRDCMVLLFFIFKEKLWIGSQKLRTEHIQVQEGNDLPRVHKFLIPNQLLQNILQVKTSSLKAIVFGNLKNSFLGKLRHINIALLFHLAKQGVKRVKIPGNFTRIDNFVIFGAHNCGSLLNLSDFLLKLNIKMIGLVFEGIIYDLDVQIKPLSFFRCLLSFRCFG